MRELTETTLGEAFTLCSQHSGYRVCIMFDDRYRLNDFVHNLKEIGNIPGIIHITRRSGSTKLIFYNNSVISIKCIELNRRGVKCNSALFSAVRELTDDEKVCIRAMELPYHSSEAQSARDAVLFATEFGALSAVERMKSEINQTQPSEDDSSEELDEFLNGFKVSEKS